VTNLSDRHTVGPKKSQWQNHYTESVDHLHVMPVGDTIPHCPANTCYCGPSVELVDRPDQSVGVVFLHKVLRK